MFILCIDFFLDVFQLSWIFFTLPPLPFLEMPNNFGQCLSLESSQSSDNIFLVDFLGFTLMFYQIDSHAPNTQRLFAEYGEDLDEARLCLQCF